ncbi:50S ribosomal protein L4 [bacterium]|nr:50S ribosomal protein L4 [bacterium]
MTSTQVLDLKGKKVGDVQLKNSAFTSAQNEHHKDAALHTMHLSVVRELANARSGSANSKTRAEVRGGGRKPWRQKGTGKARVGSIRSPLWNGGGVTFGPKPRDYSKDMPQKMRVAALREAVGYCFDKLVVVNGFEDFANSKETKGYTKRFNQILKDLQLEGKKVVLALDFDGEKLAEQSQKTQMASRNIAKLKVVRLGNLSVKDLLNAEAIILTQGSLEKLNERLAPSKAQQERVAAKTGEKKSGKAKKAKVQPKKAAPSKKEKSAKAPKAKIEKEKSAKKAEAPQAKKEKATEAKKPAKEAKAETKKDGEKKESKAKKSDK